MPSKRCGAAADFLRPTAFGELCKIIFVKISDEQKPRKNGEPYQFQIKTREPSNRLAERINALIDEQKTKDPEVFTEDQGRRQSTTDSRIAFRGDKLE